MGNKTETRQTNTSIWRKMLDGSNCSGNAPDFQRKAQHRNTDEGNSNQIKHPATREKPTQTASPEQKPNNKSAKP